MKKFLIALFVFGFMFSFSSYTNAQRRSGSRRMSSYVRNRSSQRFQFTDDMLSKVNRSCPKTLQRAKKKSEELIPFCSIRDLEFGEADLGPWRKAVSAFERLFYQFRRLIYIGAVFMVLWIFVQAAYNGDMKWMHIAMLLIGVVLLSLTEVLLAMAENKITVEDVIDQGIYVDCRSAPTSNNLSNRSDAYYKCNIDDNGAALYDSRYFLQISGKISNTSAYKGLF